MGTCDIGAFESRGFTLTKSGGDGQSTAVSTPFTNPLVVTVSSGFSEPVNGGQVTFTAPSSGASTNPAVNAATIASGAVSQSVTANGTAGGPYTVTASAAGATSVNFSLTNTPGCSSAITVTNNADSGAGSLRQAIADVCPGGTITFNSDYTITLTSGELAIGKDVTIDGQTNNVAVSGNNASRVFNITSGNVTLNKLTIANGNASGSSGGGILNSGTLTVTNSTISGNLADDGGGMYNNSSSPTLTNVTFSGNSATYGPGGGMYNNSSSPTLTNVTFSGNSATQVGGGMFNQSSSNPTLTNVTFSGNSAYSGGGMYNWVSSSPTLTNVTFSGNSATNAGGGMYNTYLSSPTLKNVIIANSTSGGDCVNNSVTLDASSSNNLIEDAANSCGLTGGSNGNIVGKPPLLGSLAVTAERLKPSRCCPARPPSTRGMRVHVLSLTSAA